MEEEEESDQGALREIKAQLQQAVEFGQGLLDRNQELLEKSQNLSRLLNESTYREGEINAENALLHENIIVRQEQLEREKEELEKEKEELEQKKRIIAEEENRLNVPDDTKEKEMCDGVRETNEILQAELEKLTHDHNDLQEKYIDEKGEWEERKKELTRQITEQNGELKDLKSKIEGLKSKIDQKSGLPDENEKLREMLDNNKQEYDLILLQKDNELKKCHSELNRFKEGDTGLSLADELDLENPSNEEMRNLESENDRLRNEIKRLEDEGEKTRQKIKELATI